MEKKMKTADDIWEDIGSLSEDEMFHVITKLFDIYDNKHPPPEVAVLS